MKTFLIFAAVLFAQTGNSQSLPPIFTDTPRQLVASRTIAEFPVNTFLENIVVDGKGDLFITNLDEGKIERVSPNGTKAEFAKIAGKIAGLAFDKKGNLLVTGWAGGQTPTVFQVDKAGRVETLAAIAGAEFLNGITHLRGDQFLIADSYKGAIWLFDAQTKKYAVWLADEKLARANPKNPFPGVNGLRIYNNTLYATNTERQTLLKIPIDATARAGKPEIWLEKINGDDFALDERGYLFVTTHVYNNVVKISPQGQQTIIAENGSVIGDTSLAFGRGKNKHTIFVVTNGGLSLPPAGGVQTAKVVRLEIRAER